MVKLVTDKLTDEENRFLLDFAQEMCVDHKVMLDWSEDFTDQKRDFIKKSMGRDNKKFLLKVISKQDIYTEMFNSMFNLQSRLNDFTNGDKWRTGITKEGRKINWMRCVRQETSELIDSFNWKHWKDINKKDDIYNAKVELVDIIHFMISQSLLADIKPKNVWSNFVRTYNTKDTIVELSETIIEDSFNIDYNNDKDVCCTDNVNRYFIYSIWKVIATIAYKLDFTLDDIYELYMTKNILNIFRQNNGYKDGTYLKLWGENNIEDNVILSELMYFINNEETDEFYGMKFDKNFDVENIEHILISVYNKLNKRG